MQIIGIYINKVYANDVLKNLKKGWYPFGVFPNCNGIFDQSGNINTPQYEEIKGKIERNQKFTNRLYQLQNSNIKINLNCILGKNGSGKSSLLNLEYRLINNFSCLINYCLIDHNQGHSLIWAYGFDAELYYYLGGNIYCIKVDNNSTFKIVEQQDEEEIINPIENVHFLYNKAAISDDDEDINTLFAFLKNSRAHNSYTKEFKTNEKKLINQLSKNFFYTISTNYSIYSNATIQDKYSEKEEQWQNKIYHKNDGYLTPIVLVPYKDYGATIDTVKELKLAKERVSTLAILVYLEKEDSFIENLIPLHVEYQLKSHSSYLEEIKQKYVKLFPSQMESNNVVTFETLDKLYKLSKLHNNIRYKWYLRLFKENNEYQNWNINQLNKNKKRIIIKNTLEYLSYKTIKMCHNYDIYRKEFPEKNIINDFLNFPEKFEKATDKIINGLMTNSYRIDFTNLKIYQCIQFLNNFDLYNIEFPEVKGQDKIQKTFVSKLETVEMIKYKKYFKNNKIKLTYDNVFKNLLPPYFYKETKFYKKDSEKIKKPISLANLSSGESQLFNALSYAIYHMKNASSKQNSNERIVYNYANIVFDEAELYYHPEYQRKFIKDLLNIIDKSNLENISSINITLVTHSPFMLSDIPKSNILALIKGNVKPEIEFNTLGSNIYDLLKNQFFMESTIGAQTENNINSFLHFYNEAKKDSNFKFNKEDKVFFETLINSIGETYLHSRLHDMLLQLERLSYNDRRIKDYEYKIDLYKNKITELENKIEQINDEEN